MTEQELDRIMRRVLIDSLKMDDERGEKDQAPSFEPTSRYKRQMRAMLADPLSWLHRQEHSRWQQIARRVAIILITCIVALGGIIAISPTARATIVRWVVEWYENTIAYRYLGEQNTEALPQYDIAKLPDGYMETVRDIAPGLVAVTYENMDEDVIYFDYSFIHQGAGTDFILNEDDVFDVLVNQMPGQYLESHIPGNLNSLTWIDSSTNTQFTVSGCFDVNVLLDMAESVFLFKMPN